jgi:hypothetical protein
MSFEYKRWKENQFRATNDTPTHAGGCPTILFLVGVIWVAVGLLLLLTILMHSLKSGKPSPFVGLVFFGLFHLSSGLQTIYGRAAGTIRSGIGSVFLGFVWTMVAVVGAKQGTNPNAPLIALGVGVVGVSLLVAGCLAMLFSPTYQRWRKTI